LFNGNQSYFLSNSCTSKNLQALNKANIVSNAPFNDLLGETNAQLNFKKFFHNDIFSESKEQLNNDSKQLFKHIVYNSCKNSIVQDYTKLAKHEDFDEFSR
jgi:hypothetical protein